MLVYFPSPNEQNESENKSSDDGELLKIDSVDHQKDDNVVFSKETKHSNLTILRNTNSKQNEPTIIQDIIKAFSLELNRDNLTIELPKVFE